MPKRKAASTVAGGWVRRVRAAWYNYQARHGAITQEELGERIASVLGRERAYPKQQVSDYFTKSQPNFTVGVAIALALEADPVELAGLAKGVNPKRLPPLDHRDEQHDEQKA